MRWKDLCNMTIDPEEPVVLPRIEKAKRESRRKRGIWEQFRWWRIMVAESQKVALDELFQTWTAEVGHERAVDRIIAACSDYHARHLNA